jgi:hypothetical protein
MYVVDDRNRYGIFDGRRKSTRYILRRFVGQWGNDTFFYCAEDPAWWMGFEAKVLGNELALAPRNGPYLACFPSNWRRRSFGGGLNRDFSS